MLKWQLDFFLSIRRTIVVDARHWEEALQISRLGLDREIDGLEVGYRV